MAKHMYSSGNLKLFAAIIGECIVISCCDVCYLQSFCDDSRYHVSSSVSSDSSRQCEGVARDIVELHCSFYNDTPPADNAATYQWWRNNVLLNISSATIKYPQFDPHDGGKYQCESYDTSGSRVLCGQVELTTLPFPLDNLPPRHDGNCQYHDYVRGQSVCVENGSCQLVIPALVGGYPTPNITWYIDDHQATITVMNNKSAAILDIQLWSHLQKPTGVLIEAQNKLGNIKICTNLSLKSSNRGVGPVPFSNSTTPHKLHKGDTDAVVKTCSPDTYIGDFYICYSNNMSDLAGLDVDDEHCCYCSDVGALKCKVKMPNWRLKYTDSTCRLYLRRVTMSDVGFYQCRVFNIDYYPCKYRYGDLTSASVINHDGWITEHVTIFLLIVVVAVLFSVVIITGTSCLIWWKYHIQSSRELNQIPEEQTAVTGSCNIARYGGTDFCLPVGGPENPISQNQSPATSDQQQSPDASNQQQSSDASSQQQSPDASDQQQSPDTSGQQQSPDASNQQPSPGAGGQQQSPDTSQSPDTTGQQQSHDTTGQQQSPDTTGQQQSPDASGQQQSPVTAATTKKSDTLKVHLLHNPTQQSEEWTNNFLTPEIKKLNVAVVDETPGLPWIKQIPEIIKKGGCKIIVIITKGDTTQRFLTEFIQVVSRQDTLKPVMIPILFDCKLEELENETLSDLLSVYTTLNHHQVNSSSLQRSLFN